jgi:polar amino acid transport system substrate-binding protein
MKMIIKISLIIYIISMTAWVPASAQDATLKLAALEYPPFIHQNGDRAEGEIADVVREIFFRLGRTIKIEFFPASRGMAMLSSGDVDAMFTLKKNAERENTMLFPKQPLIRQDFVFFVLKDSKVAYNGDLSTMSNIRIGVVNQTSYGTKFDTAVKNGKIVKLEISQSFENNFQKLLARRMQAVINSRDVGNQILKNLGAESRVMVTGPPVETVDSYLAFTRKKDLTALAEAFDKVVISMKNDGTINKIRTKYK